MPEWLSKRFYSLLLVFSLVSSVLSWGQFVEEPELIPSLEDWERADPDEEIVLTGAEYNLIIDLIVTSEKQAINLANEATLHDEKLARSERALILAEKTRLKLTENFDLREESWKEHAKEMKTQGLWLGIAIGGTAVVLAVGIPVLITALSGGFK